MPVSLVQGLSMPVTRRILAAAALLSAVSASPALAQKVTTVPDLTLKQTLGQMASTLSTRPTAEAIAAATALEIATAPTSSSSGGFVFKLDPSTGLLVRTTTTFGPAFTERAMTSGEGQVSVGATFSASTYDKLSGLPLNNLTLGSVNSTNPLLARTGTANLALTSKTLTMSTIVGVTENLDIAVVVPMVSIALNGSSSSLTRGDAVVSRLAEAKGTFSGLGDISAMAKYRLYSFKGGPLPDPGGIAVVVNAKLPTGSKDNLLGLGINRTLVSVVGSGVAGRVRPHGSVGFEYWNKSLDVPTGVAGSTVSIRHQLQYAAGTEVEVTPKVTLNLDFLGQQIRGGGQVGLVTDQSTTSGITGFQSLVVQGDSINKALFVPGIKVNLKAKMLLSLNAIMTMKNDGLHSKVTPVVGLNLTL